MASLQSPSLISKIKSKEYRTYIWSVAEKLRHRRAFLAIVLVVGKTVPAVAFPLDGCEQQRKQYPADWNDTSAEKTLFTCESQQGISTSKSEQQMTPAVR